MARYFAGNTLAAFRRSTTGIVEVTTGGTFDSNYVSNAILVGTSAANYIETSRFEAEGVVWSHFEFYASGVDTTGTGPTWLNDGTPVFRINRNDPLGNYSFTPQYWNGSAWVTAGNTFSTDAAGRHQMDVKIDLTNGAFEIYADMELESEGDSWSGHQTKITHWRGYPESGNNTGTRYSQVMISDYDMRLSKYMTLAINGDGTYTDGTGAYTDVDETVVSDLDTVILPAIGDKKGFTKAALSIPVVGYIIGAAVINARGRVGGGVVTDGKLGILNGGDVNLSAGHDYEFQFGPGCHIVENDPDTSAPFTVSGFNTAEVYLEAA